MELRIKNIVFWSVFSLAILAAVFTTYLKTMVHERYYVFQQISCDPEEEPCFIETAETLCAESDNLGCIEETEDFIYKIIYKQASKVPVCSIEEGESACSEELSCGPTEPITECYYEYCEEDCA